MRYTAQAQQQFYERSKYYLSLKGLTAELQAAQQEIAELCALVEYHEWRYYILHEPVLSDYEYDQLYKRLEALESAFPQAVLSHSPTQRVSTDLVEGFPTVAHLAPMLSLENSYNAEDLRDFDKRLRKLLALEADVPLDYGVEPKYDGGTIVLVYEDDLLQRAATRGNGQAGEEITANARTMRSLPLQAPFAQHGIRKVELRGEALIAKPRFEQLNAQRLSKGEELFANPRNAATGALRMKDPRQMAERGLEVFVYQLGYLEGELQAQTHSQALDLLANLGFKVPQAPQERRLCRGIEEVIAFCQDWEARREAYDYELDGMVIKLDNLRWQQQLGYTGHHPRWAIAYKFAAKQATTKLLDVEFQVGRTGAITPVAKLQPVDLAGVSISSVSLHNEDMIAAKDLRLGDVVLVERAGDVIPQIVKSLSELREGSEREIVFPRQCPACQTALERPEGEAIWRCPNSTDCPAQALEGFIHFVSKDAMDIEGLGQSIVERLYQEGMLQRLGDLYRLDYAYIQTWEGFGKRSVDNLRKAIEASKQQALHRLIFGLGIRFVGKRTAQTLAVAVESIFDFAQWTEADFMRLDDIGPKVASQAWAYFQKPAHIALLQELQALGLQTSRSEADLKAAGQGLTGPLSGKTILFTGTLSQMSRPEAENLAREAGAKILSGVSAKLNYLVAGEAAGSKLDKAQKLGVPVLSETEFLDLINNPTKS